MIWLSQCFCRSTVATATVPYHSDQTLSVADFRDQTFFYDQRKDGATGFNQEISATDATVHAARHHCLDPNFHVAQIIWVWKACTWSRKNFLTRLPVETLTSGLLSSGLSTVRSISTMGVPSFLYTQPIHFFFCIGLTISDWAFNSSKLPGLSGLSDSMRSQNESILSASSYVDDEVQVSGLPLLYFFPWLVTRYSEYRKPNCPTQSCSTFLF